MTLVSPVLVQALDQLGRSDGSSPVMRKTSQISKPDSGVAVISVDGDLYGYSLTEILLYLIERAEKTDTEIDDMRAGAG